MTTSMQTAHRTALLRRAERILARKRNNTLNFTSITSDVNNQFGTNYSVYQVSAVLGRAGYRQTNTSRNS